MGREEVALINKELDQYLPDKGILAKAMRYSVFAGGKRFRPILCLATAKAIGCPPKKILPFACALELLHTFTLIHDDLPAMDNSDFRRGKPSCHKAFGEDIAILAGDALNILAFESIAFYPEASKLLGEALFKVVEGQVLDIKSAGKRLTLNQVINIHELKTGALLNAAVRGPGLICGLPTKSLKALAEFADHLGLAFQITDDILDVTSTKNELGKPVGADFNKGFPYVVGLVKAKQMAIIEKNKAIKALKSFGDRAESLIEIAEYVVLRGN